MTDLAEKLAGKFIVLDGPDGSGKTTQLGLLRDHLAVHEAAVEAARGMVPDGDLLRAMTPPGYDAMRERLAEAAARR